MYHDDVCQKAKPVFDFIGKYDTYFIVIIGSVR